MSKYLFIFFILISLSGHCQNVVLFPSMYDNSTVDNNTELFDDILKKKFQQLRFTIFPHDRSWDNYNNNKTNIIPNNEVCIMVIPHITKIVITEDEVYYKYKIIYKSNNRKSFGVDGRLGESSEINRDNINGILSGRFCNNDVLRDNILNLVTTDEFDNFNDDIRTGLDDTDAICSEKKTMNNNF